MNQAAVVERLEEIGVVAVVRIADHERLMDACRAIAAGGVSAIEITMSVPDPFGAIRTLAKELGDSILVGVGSVLDGDVAREAVDAGARYVVSPVFRREVIEAAHGAGAPAIAGAFSPTEILAADRAGADIVKVFPADVLGMSYFTSVLAPMPDLRLMPTGGVTLDNGGDWVRAGAVAVGVGTALLDKALIEARDWTALEANARRLKAGVDGARPGKAGGS